MMNGCDAAHQWGERHYTLDEALHNITEEIDRLGLTADLYAATEDDLGAWRCELRYKGKKVAQGNGKGTRKAAQVGALYEAFEHYQARPESHRPHIRTRSSHGISAGPLREEHSVSLLAEFEDLPIGCLPYADLTGGSVVDVPAYLTMPYYAQDGSVARGIRGRVGDDYPYASTQAIRYSSNNGWGSGADITEATLHGLNEVIERDATSLLLITQFLSENPSPLKVLDPGSLPRSLRDLVYLAERQLGDSIHIIDMTTDIGVPSYTAFLRSTGPASVVRGAGTSLSRYYAVARAVTELAQTHSISTGLSPDIQISHELVKPYPRLHRCLLSDFANQLPGAEIISYQESAPISSPGEHLAKVMSALRDSGFSIHRWTAFEGENSAVVSVLVPGLERFFLVSDGNVVVPGDRGLKALEATKAKVA
jgi:ribosomal protein S12 methylthiotransferase accessory factor